MQVDLHLHSKYSYDAEPCEIAELAAAAEERGLSIIAITDHKDFFRAKPALELDLEGIARDIEAVRETSRIQVLRGIEVGEPHTPEAQAFLAAHSFDYVIGSLHAMPHDTDFYFLPYETLDCDALIADYLEELLRVVEAGGFDTLAHIDYPLRVMRHGDYFPSFERFMDGVVPVLRAVIDRELALELNAATLFGWKREPGPERFVLEEYRRLGGTRISLGSDAHSAKDVGRGMAEYAAYARSLGFDRVTVYENRKPREIML